MDSIFTVTNRDLEKFDPKQAVEIFRDLLWAEATKTGVPLNRVNISSWINVPDGGVYARIDAPAQQLNGLIKSGPTAYQIKAGSFIPLRVAEIRRVLFRPNQTTHLEHLLT